MVFPGKVAGVNSPRNQRMVRDNDDTGRHGTEITTQFWDSLGVANKVVELPPEVGDGGDLRDYFALLEGGDSRHERGAA